MIVLNSKKVNFVMELFYTTVLQHHIKTAFANNFDSSSLRDLNLWQIEWRGAEKGICRWKLSLAVLFKTCVNVVKLVNLILHMSRYFLAVKSIWWLCVHRSKSSQQQLAFCLRWPLWDARGSTFFLPNCCSKEHLFPLLLCGIQAG